MGSYKAYRDAALAEDPELRAEYDALEDEYRKIQKDYGEAKQESSFDIERNEWL